MEVTILLVFILGYLAITFEQPLRFTKSASALLTGVLCWTIYILAGKDAVEINQELLGHLGSITGILFFLLGAMTIVELIDAHDGFHVITSSIKTTNKRKLLWIISIVSFFLSAVLDNLTTAIVMTSLTTKLISDKQDRMVILGMVIIAANAGGAWSPIGDVTTTMLWIGGQITTGNVILNLFVPSLVCMLVPLLLFSISIKGYESGITNHQTAYKTTTQERSFVLIAGILALLFVPVFKILTGLPPFMGMLFALGVLWVVIELMHSNKPKDEKGPYSVASALRKIDTPSILFFLGILLAVAALESTGMLSIMAVYLNQTISDEHIIVMTLGIISSIIDNVPLVAAAMGMYDLTIYSTDHFFWMFMAYCCGTGGSILILGSAAGVAVMGMEKIGFFWYLKKVTLYALIGFFAGAFLYIAMGPLFH